MLLVAALHLTPAHAQFSFHATIKDSTTREPLIGVTVVLKGTDNGTVSGPEGDLLLKDIPPGSHVITLRFPGYETVEYHLSFPSADTQRHEILMAATEEVLHEIIVEGTRSNRSIANTPTRVEVLTEEIDEASTMDPSKVSHLLTHSTGIQVQQTSATSNSANVRIQGLDGRYTQILKDGFPLYGGFSGSLSITQIPPLDLRQVEYIKGSASTLYGGGAIAGLINLISKIPDNEETLLHLNASQIGAFDVNAFVSRKSGKIGFTLLTQRNTHQAYDVDDDGYSDMPALTKFNLNPKLFFYFSEQTKLTIGGTLTNEQRQGGDMKLMDESFPDSSHFYKESNDINRITTQLRLDHRVREDLSITARNSFSYFERSLQITPAPSLQQYRFAGKQLSSFSELALTYRIRQQVLITGVNFYTDDFKEQKIQNNLLRNENFNTIGAFANYTFDISRTLALESGLRTDYVFDERLFVLPRASALFRWTSKLTTRIGGGLGYRNPTIFNQEAELFGYQNVLPIDRDKVNAEESYGGNADVGYKTMIGERFSLNINQMFFYTRLQRPVVFSDVPGQPGYFHYVNADGYTQSTGSETFVKFGFYDFMFFLGYTYTHATQHFNGSSSLVTLTPRHSIKGDLLYSIPGKWRIGADYEFKSSQTLGNGWTTPSYWTFGALIEYTTGPLTIFANAENFTDVRQTNYGSLRSQPYDTPQLTEVWAPLDGFVLNGGFKIRL